MVVYEYETKSGTRWGVRAYLGIDEATGKQVDEYKRGFKTKKEAQLHEARAKLRFIDGEEKEKTKSYTFEEVYNLWLPRYENSVRESTFHKTQQNFKNHILPEFSKYIISKIEAKHIQPVVDKWHKKMKKYKEIYNMFKRVMQFAVTQEIIKSNPCDKVAVPTKKLDYGIEKTTKDFYNKEELQDFMKVLEDYGSLKWLVCFRLLAYTGIRRGELLALTWEDIDFNEATLSINKALTTGTNNRLYVGDPKNKESERVVDVDTDTIKLLKEWRVEQAAVLIGFGHNAMSKAQLLLSQAESNKHLYLSAPRNALKRVCDKYNYPMINIHGFRHTHASLLFEAAVSLKDVMARLGHSDIETTMNIYTHVTPQSRKDSAEKFAEYIEL